MLHCVGSEVCSMIKLAFPFCVAMGLLGVGALAIVDAKKSAATYGLPTEDATALALIRALGARDIVVGLGILTHLRNSKSLVVFSSLIAVADFSLVGLVSEKPPRSSLMIHGGGAIALLIGGLFFSGSQDRRDP